MSWKPTKDYGAKEALDDLLKDGPVTDVLFTEHGVMKEYADGHVSDFVDADNDKGHNSYTYKQGSDGIWRGSEHKTNR